jgi:hypothetical protein
MYNYNSNRSSILTLKKSIKENRIKNNLNKKISFFIFIISFLRYIYLLQIFTSLRLNYIQSINLNTRFEESYNLNNVD